MKNGRWKTENGKKREMTNNKFQMTNLTDKKYNNLFGT